MLSHIEQSRPGLRQHFPAVNETQLMLLSGSCRLWQDHRDQIVSPPLQLRPFDGGIVQELHRLPVHLYAFHLQESRQFEQQRAGAIVSDLDLQSGFGMNLFRWSHFACNRATDLVKSLTKNCQKQGIEIMAVAITSIQPPEITEPVQQREVAKQKLAQFRREKLQQLSEAKLKVEVVLADQKKKVVEAEQEVVEKTTKAEQEQQVAVTLAEQKLKVAQTRFEAAKDKASAVVAKAGAEAEVIKFDNAAEAAGLAAQVAAFDGDGGACPATCSWPRSPRRSAPSWATRKVR